MRTNYADPVRTKGELMGLLPDLSRAYGADAEDELALPPGATSLDLLQAICSDLQQPLATRMRAATSRFHSNIRSFPSRPTTTSDAQSEWNG
jgi:hypothetical protein